MSEENKNEKKTQMNVDRNDFYTGHLVTSSKLHETIILKNVT